MYILGLNAYHGDSSAALVKDGIVVAAVEEERFTRVKHWAGIPLHAIDYCLGFAGIRFDQLGCVAVNSDNSVHKLQKIVYLLKSRPGIRLLKEKLGTRAKRENLLQGIAKHTSHKTDNVPFISVEHHHAHLASAFYPSGFESAALLSIDGFGDFSSGAMGAGSGDKIDILKYVHFPHSLGIFYQAITQFLGFGNYGDEYKVMGLASYGVPDYADELSDVLEISDNGDYRLNLSYFRHQNHSVYSRSETGVPQFSDLYSEKLASLLGPVRSPGDDIDLRHKNIASSAQHLYEQALFSILRNLHQQTGKNHLAIAGGCAMNSVANGKIKSNTGFEEVYVQPAGGDAGGAIGAALVGWQETQQQMSRPVMEHAYLGPGYSNDEVQSAIDSAELSFNREYAVKQYSEDLLVDVVAGALDKGAVVGWFQGRMEWGPRALGNRSILADPRRTDMQDLLNRKIKRRESFRPFAPSILEKDMAEWFEIEDRVPFMEKVYPIRKEKQPLIPAVTHVDGTGRLQTVNSKSNPRYYRLIEKFNDITGVPILLNTSFNENEPVVCNPDQAIDCFLRTQMDILVIEDFVISRVVES